MTDQEKKDKTSPAGGIYERAGRAAPTEILPAAPAQPEAETTAAKENASLVTELDDDLDLPDAAATSVFPKFSTAPTPTASDPIGHPECLQENPAPEIDEATGIPVYSPPPTSVSPISGMGFVPPSQRSFVSPSVPDAEQHNRPPISPLPSSQFGAVTQGPRQGLLNPNNMPVMHSETELTPAADPDREFAPAASAEPETTVLPAAPVAQPQPKPEVDPATEITPAVAPAPVEAVATADPVVPEAAPVAAAAVEKRGTQSFGLFLLRVAAAALLISSSLAVFFQLGNSSGLAGLETKFVDFSYPTYVAIAIPALQLLAGAFLLLGLLTPVAAALGIAATVVYGLVTVLAHTDSAWWLAGEVREQAALLGILLAIQFTGPGKFGLDFGRRWVKRPLVSSWLCGIVGLALGLAAVYFLGGSALLFR